MSSHGVRRRIAASPFARAAAFPVRLGQVARFNGRKIAQSSRWLITSREHTNYTYDLTAKNSEYLAWWCSTVSGESYGACRDWLAEITEDGELVERVEKATRGARRRGLSDPTPRFGRRAGWYCLVRALKPSHIVETGTDKGLGSLVLARALQRNGSGQLTTIDINDDSGYLITSVADLPVSRRIGDSVSIIRELDSVELFIHDSDHSYVHEMAEYRAIEEVLAPSGLVLSDNAELTSALSDWSKNCGRRFLYFAEEPENHWYPGGGIGASLTLGSR